MGLSAAVFRSPGRYIRCQVWLRRVFEVACCSFLSSRCFGFLEKELITQIRQRGFGEGFRISLQSLRKRKCFQKKEGSEVCSGSGLLAGAKSTGRRQKRFFSRRRQSVGEEGQGAFFCSTIREGVGGRGGKVPRTVPDFREDKLINGLNSAQVCQLCQIHHSMFQFIKRNIIAILEIFYFQRKYTKFTLNYRSFTRYHFVR